MPVSWPGFALDSVKRRAASSEALRDPAGYAISRATPPGSCITHRLTDASNSRDWGGKP